MKSKYQVPEDKKKYLFSYLLFLFFYFLSLISQTSAAEKLELTLSEAINMSLRENLSLAGERINPKIAEADIKFRKGEFDPNIDLKATESYKNPVRLPFLQAQKKELQMAISALAAK